MIPPSFGEVLRVLRAENPGPFTLDGTRTHIVGHTRPAVVDPGPDVADHVRAVVRAVEEAREVTLLVTHGHADHAGAVDPVAEALRVRGVPVRVAGSGHPRAVPLGGDDAVATDAGTLVAVETPGHTPDHLAFHWPERAALFPGDLLLGRGDTTWVAGYRGCVADYLTSLRLLRGLELRLLLPTHGPPLDDPAEALERFEGHRLERIGQVRTALDADPDADAAALVERIYGDEVPEGLRSAAVMSVEAILDHLGHGPGLRPDARIDAEEPHP